MEKNQKNTSLIPYSLSKKKAYRSISNPKPESDIHKLNTICTNDSSSSPSKPEAKSLFHSSHIHSVRLSPLPFINYNKSRSFKRQSFVRSSLEIPYNRYESLISSKLSPIPEQEIPVKKAMKNKEWLIKAKESLIQEISTILNSSNGISVSTHEACYKYYLGKGNNSLLVKQIISSRWWWTCVNEDQLPNVNMVWTQNINNEYISTIPVVYYRPTEPSFLINSIKCSVPYEKNKVERVKVNISSLGYDLITNNESFTAFKQLKTHVPVHFRTHNKIEDNFYLTDKKFLYKLMKRYYEAVNDDVFNHLPLTFHVTNTNCREFKDFVLAYQLGSINNTQNNWIVKPGENSNRGNGISLTNDMNTIMALTTSDKSPGFHTFIIQKYIEKPFLIHKRKFDIRLYTLVTSINGIMQCYFYKEGYLRTASKEYNAKNLDKFIHLTNDAIQKYSEDYGKFENGNKLSYFDFQKYLDSKNIKKNFYEEILPEIKKIVKDTVMASFKRMDCKRRSHSFEIFGYDFLLDSELKPWLLEVNTNPCLELSSTLLVRLIPAMLENAIRIAVDPVFPQPLTLAKHSQNSFSQDFLTENKFELIFHEEQDGKTFLEFLEKSDKLHGFMKDFFEE